jgi:CobQ-like glutamine amidotransferase family enzyme
LAGAGNNPEAKFEGARYKNVIGTYLHGSVLPKNPELTDFLIAKALKNKGKKLPEITKENQERAEFLERITKKAREIAMTRPR